MSRLIACRSFAGINHENRVGGAPIGEELDATWNPRNKSLADSKFYADIKRYGCERQSGWFIDALCALPNQLIAIIFHYFVAEQNHKDWPVTATIPLHNDSSSWVPWALLFMILLTGIVIWSVLAATERLAVARVFLAFGVTGAVTPFLFLPQLILQLSESGRDQLGDSLAWTYLLVSMVVGALVAAIGFAMYLSLKSEPDSRIE